MMDKIRLIRSDRGPHLAYINGERITADASQRIMNHSPDGFEWGYGGSGPSQLALAILYHVTQNKNTSLMLYHRFKEEFIATVSGDDEEITVDIREWVKKGLEEEDARLSDKS